MVSFSSEIILTSSADGPITAYDPLTGAALANFSSTGSPRKGLALAGTTLIAASHVSTATASGIIHLYSWCSPSPLHCIPLAEPIAPLIATFDGSYLFAGGLSGHIHMLSVPSTGLHRSFPAHWQPVSCLAVNDDGSLLISGCDDGTIAVFPILRLLDLAALEGDEDDDDDRLALHRITAHRLSVTGIASGPGGCNANIISSSLDCTCKLWSLSDGFCLRTVSFPSSLWCVVVDGTNSEMYAGGSDGLVYAVPLKKFGGRAVTAVGEAEVAAWASGNSIGAVTAIAMANGNQNLVSATEDGILIIWAAESGSIVSIFGHEGSGISEVVVARSRRDIEGIGYIERSPGWCGRELGRQVREVEEMERCLGVVANDRRGTLNTLEVAIATYKKLLRLLLKEAKQCDREEEGMKNLDPSL